MTLIMYLINYTFIVIFLKKGLPRRKGDFSYLGLGVYIRAIEKDLTLAWNLRLKSFYDSSSSLISVMELSHGHQTVSRGRI